MKKIVLILSVAALALASCVKTSDVYTGSPDARQISFSPLAQPATKAAVDGVDFPNIAMMVTAYDVTNTRDFFGATAFSKGTTTWTGSKYWPLSEAYINFLAIANANADNATDVTWGPEINSVTSNKTEKVQIVMADNKTEQRDLMYAIGHGEVTQSGNALSFNAGNPVSMVFNHAQAWISFYADAYDATSGGKVTLQSITLNGAKYAGTFTVTHTNYNASSSQSVAGAWTVLGSAADVAVPNWTPAAIAYDSSGNGVPVGDGLLVVPDDDSDTPDFDSFTIAYTLDGKNYSYTYTPTVRNVDQKKHYIYNINFHLHEIEIAASVTDWADQTGVDVPII